MPSIRISFLIMILLSSFQLQQSSKASQANTWQQARQIRDKENPSEKECDFTSYKPKRYSDFPGPNQVVEKAAPEYPELAKKAHIKGTVIVRILVDQDGKVIRACALSGHPLLRSAAVSAALKWKFKKWCSLCPQKTFVESDIEFRFNADESTNVVERQEKKSS